MNDNKKETKKKEKAVILTWEGLRMLTLMNYSGGIGMLYEKDICFYGNFPGDVSILYQLFGNWGVRSTSELEPETFLCAISNGILKDFKKGIRHPFIEDLDKKLNQRNSPYRKIKFITETHLLDYIARQVLDNEQAKEIFGRYKQSKKKKKNNEPCKLLI